MASTPGPSRANAWLRPGHVGMEVAHRDVPEEALTEAQLVALFAPADGELASGAVRRFEALWRKQNAVRARAGRPTDEAGPRPDDPAFRPRRGPPEALVWELSRSEVRVWILKPLGVSRWHRFYELVASLRAPRGARLDALLALEALERKLGATYSGIGNGTPLEAALAKLGPRWDEYLGQSMVYRQLYFPEHDVQLEVAWGAVVTVRRGPPGWLGSDAVQHHGAPAPR